MNVDRQSDLIDREIKYSKVQMNQVLQRIKNTVQVTPSHDELLWMRLSSIIDRCGSLIEELDMATELVEYNYGVKSADEFDGVDYQTYCGHRQKVIQEPY